MKLRPYNRKGGFVVAKDIGLILINDPLEPEENQLYFLLFKLNTTS